MRMVDKDLVMATAELIGRSGAKHFQIGYLHDDVPVEKAGWYASAVYRGAKLFAEGASPNDACSRLIVRVLQGALCTKCGRETVLEGYELASGAPACTFRRRGPHFERSCQVVG